MEDKIILNTSDEAAQLKTVTGWVSRDGHFFGNDERSARWSGCTHTVCECGKPCDKSWLICAECLSKLGKERYNALEKREWDGEGMLYSQSHDEFFSDESDIEDHCDQHDCSIEDLRLVICEPVYATQIDPNEYYHDELPEDGDVHADLEEAFNVLNKAIENHKCPLSWVPGKFAAKLTLIPQPMRGEE